jgi:hypothetical protein
MFLAEDAEYPEGMPGQIAVCFWLSSGTHWSFEIAQDRDDAKRLYLQACRDPKVMSVLVDGGMHKSAVVWMMQCDGDAAWHWIGRPKGAKAHLDAVWFRRLLHSN